MFNLPSVHAENFLYCLFFFPSILYPIPYEFSVFKFTKLLLCRKLRTGYYIFLNDNLDEDPVPSVLRPVLGTVTLHSKLDFLFVLLFLRMF